MSDDSLLPVEQKTVLFYEDEITAVRVESGDVFVPLRPLCDRLGVAWNAQYERIKRDAVLSDVTRGVRVTRTPEKGGTQEMTCLPLKYLNGWLFGINANRVKAEVRDKLIRYQRQVYDVLHEAFQEGRLSLDADIEALAKGDSEAAVAYRMAQAIVRMARHQLMLEAEQREHGRKLDDHEQRLVTLEETAETSIQSITDAQAAQISQAVKAVALALSKQSGRNEYGGVYGELYRRFEVTSYKLLPANKFQEAMDWLTEWHQQVVGDSAF